MAQGEGTSEMGMWSPGPPRPPPTAPGSSSGVEGEATSSSGSSGPLDTIKAVGGKALVLLQNRAQLAPLRMPADFFGLGAPKPFSIPAAGEAAQRLRLNLPHYSSNYTLSYVALCAMTIVTSPTALLALVATAGGWAALLRSTADPQTEGVSIGPITVKRQVAFMAMGIVSVFTGLLLLGTLLGWSLWLAAALAAGHAVTRDATALADAAESRQHALEGDIEPFMNA